MKITVRPYKSSTGQEYFVLYDWYWYNCGLYTSQEKAEQDAIRILEEEKERRLKRPETERVYYELQGETIVRGVE